MPNIPIEICINAGNDMAVQHAVKAAYQGGAARIELCAEMELDGITPKPAFITTAREAFPGRAGLLVMIRPRAGDFVYSTKELAAMQHQIETAGKAGADGVVFGVLQAMHHQVDTKAMSRLINTANNHQLAVTFHRAFDATPNVFETLQIAIELGVRRILTSGTVWGSTQSAIDGIDTLAHLIEQAQQRVEIVIGKGISPHNVRKLLKMLPKLNGGVSVHAYSGVLEKGQTSAALVKALRMESSQ